ncbi:MULTISPECIES: hypothetical protein [Streptococcus]|uniref:hypothetical protein n=1 Tax=Streptococcus TaxID=1301 RepID=UPI00137B363B|nr:hypothetical protein [Streptococcus suis]MBM0194964.1 hypothetical protein [Streptococcus suis]HEM6091776.1 hypothetical protein [Streptococcus suis]HEM6219100.1 hypothetical protein [Streptococcus suis]HEM6253588.1 hypothetical protein [Streptococcus suis]HEM6361404.1 hypothetical protein [Streptococcus suis]
MKFIQYLIMQMQERQAYHDRIPCDCNDKFLLGGHLPLPKTARFSSDGQVFYEQIIED